MRAAVAIATHIFRVAASLNLAGLDPALKRIVEPIIDPALDYVIFGCAHFFLFSLSYFLDEDFNWTEVALDGELVEPLLVLSKCA